MANVISCSQCRAAVMVPEDMAGKTVRCPTCSTTFVAPETGMVAGRPPFAGHAVLPSVNPDWTTVRNGLTLMLAALLLLALAVSVEGILSLVGLIIFFGMGHEGNTFILRALIAVFLAAIPGAGLAYLIGWLTARAPTKPFLWGLAALGGGAKVLLFLAGLGLFRGGPGTEDISMSYGAVIGIELLVGCVLCLVGMIMGLAAPDPRAKMFLAGSLLCPVGGICLSVLAAFTPVRAPGLLELCLVLLNDFVFLVCVFFFILYVGEIARAFANEPLVRSLQHSAVFQLVWIGLMHVLMATGFGSGMHVAQRMSGKQEIFMVLFTLIAVGGNLLYLLWFVVLLRRTRNTIDTALTILPQLGLSALTNPGELSAPVAGEV